jgi:hypothetical protein
MKFTYLYVFGPIISYESCDSEQSKADYADFDRCHILKNIWYADEDTLEFEIMQALLIIWIHIILITTYYQLGLIF